MARIAASAPGAMHGNAARTRSRERSAARHEDAYVVRAGGCTTHPGHADRAVHHAQA